MRAPPPTARASARGRVPERSVRMTIARLRARRSAAAIMSAATALHPMFTTVSGTSSALTPQPSRVIPASTPYANVVLHSSTCARPISSAWSVRAILHTLARPNTAAHVANAASLGPSVCSAARINDCASAIAMAIAANAAPPHRAHEVVERPPPVPDERLGGGDPPPFARLRALGGCGAVEAVEAAHVRPLAHQVRMRGTRVAMPPQARAQTGEIINYL